MQIRAFAAIISLVATAACADDHDPLEFTLEGDRLVAEGEIDGDTLNRFEEALDEAGDIRVLELRFVGGSVDDAANVEFARVVREMGFTTVVPGDGMVASGGTDLFLAGAQRIAEPGACIGVHSWAAEDFTATDLPRTSPEHDRYLDYYDDIGIAQAFYWFTIKAAPADGMHWVNAAEATQYGMTTEPVSGLTTGRACDAL